MAKSTGFVDEVAFREIVRHTPLVSIDLIVVDGAGRALLGERKNEPAKGFWFVPGGRIRKGERLADAFRRIVQAELGLERDVAAAEFLGASEHLYAGNVFGDPSFGTHYVVLAHRLMLSGTTCPEPDPQHHRYAWWSIDELLRSDAVHAYTRAYFARTERGAAATR